ncbi:MAG: hypothetical protein R3B93_25790 [Bacteroidia bacterium]
MTIDQKEQAILALLAELPLFRRVRIAIQIMKGVEPEQVVVENQEGNAEAFSIGNVAAKTLKNRIQGYESGAVSGTDAFQSLAKMREDLNSR